MISYKNALKGDYDDAVANAIGSNIFDICFALGLPLFLYGLIHGEVHMHNLTAEGEDGEGGKDVTEIQSLRVLLICASVVILCIFLITKTVEDDDGRMRHLVGKFRALALFGVYAIWTTAIVLHALKIIVF
eukprot:SAG11_NODE_1292_length_5285_cov_9.364057_4_plen_131_part_00